MGRHLEACRHGTRQTSSKHGARELVSRYRGQRRPRWALELALDLERRAGALDPEPVPEKLLTEHGEGDDGVLGHLDLWYYFLPHRRRRARPEEDQHGQGHAEPMYWVLGAYAARKTKPRATSYCAGLHSAQTPAASRLLVVGTSLAALVAVSDRCQARETRALCRGTGTAERRDDSRPRRAAIFGTNRCDKSSSQALDGRFVPDYFRLAPTCARRRCGYSRRQLPHAPSPQPHVLQETSEKPSSHALRSPDASTLEVAACPHTGWPDDVWLARALLGRAL
ncbi:hypothetical protein PCL_07651 [Purpureocillium lilacinum]|uniref:Uncharacterized protein n=1 Tax=Purpureocillium lilacinum TaxID=33203 RepID=A0A2U3EIJ9_PURLI|nr:hypothetical protein PCL_07651 [Purpureocillium lilacinum]